MHYFTTCPLPSAPLAPFSPTFSARATSLSSQCTHIYSCHCSFFESVDHQSARQRQRTRKPLNEKSLLRGQLAEGRHLPDGLPYTSQYPRYRACDIFFAIKNYCGGFQMPRPRGRPRTDKNIHKPVTIYLAPEDIAALDRLVDRRIVRTGNRISRTDLIREAVQRLLADNN